jgi:hypothetical protein
MDEKQLRIDVRQTFGSPHGARVLEWLSRICGERRNPYTPGSFDVTAHNCGRLSVLLDIKRQLEDEHHEEITETNED